MASMVGAWKRRASKGLCKLGTYDQSLGLRTAHINVCGFIVSRL